MPSTSEIKTSKVLYALERLEGEGGGSLVGLRLWCIVTSRNELTLSRSIAFQIDEYHQRTCLKRKRSVTETDPAKQGCTITSSGAFGEALSAYTMRNRDHPQLLKWGNHRPRATLKHYKLCYTACY